MEEIKMADFVKKIPDIFNGYVAAQLTDEYVLGSWQNKRSELCNNESKVLEIRVFDANCEYRLFRGNIGKAFIYREINDKNEGKEPYKDYWDEDQYLDIDTAASSESFIENGEVRTTGGGRYSLPLVDMTDAMVTVRYYFGCYDSGQAKISDWRLVGFKTTEGEGNNGKV